MAHRIAPAWRGVIGLSPVLLTLFVFGGDAGRAETLRMKNWTGPAPAFVLGDTKGARFSLDRGPATRTIVHFFATWCEHCREEFPALSRLARRDGEAVRVIAISVAEPEMRVRRFVAATQPDFPILLDADRKVARAWGVSVLPTSFVLDENLSPLMTAEESVAWDAIALDDLKRATKKSASAQD